MRALETMGRLAGIAEVGILEGRDEMMKRIHDSDSDDDEVLGYSIRKLFEKALALCVKEVEDPDIDEETYPSALLAMAKVGWIAELGIAVGGILGVSVGREAMMESIHDKERDSDDDPWAEYSIRKLFAKVLGLCMKEVGTVRNADRTLP